MGDKRDKIWEGDLLGRRDEADLLEEFLLQEFRRRKQLSIDQSYVLALDSAYGRGKSWFLARFAEQLELSHPVARIDVWADDASGDPFVAFMSAINSALARFLNNPTFKKKFKTALYSALPIAGKALLGLGVTTAKKYIGNEVFDDEEMRTGSPIKSSKPASSVSEIIDSSKTEIDKLIDRWGAAKLKEYERQRESRAGFKANMTALVDAIDENAEGVNAPLFVIVDELDRCRPDYAIQVLEQIKHFFDVPGVVFVIAVHKPQLVESIRSIYGSNFQSEHYLRRFFTRTIPLQPLSIRQLVVAQFEHEEIDVDRFSFPNSIAGRDSFLSLGEYTAAFLSDFDVTPREVPQCVDAVRIFGMRWKEKVPVELPLLLGHILAFLREIPLRQIGEGHDLRMIAKFEGNIFCNAPAQVGLVELLEAYRRVVEIPISEISREQNYSAAKGYVAARLDFEFQRLHNRQTKLGKVMHSVHRTYKQRVIQIGRVLDRSGDKTVGH